MRTTANQVRKHWRGLERGFNQVCTCQTWKCLTSLVRPFFSCQFLSCIPLLSCHVSGTCRNFFRMHIVDPLMMHCGMGSVSSTSPESRLRYLATRGGMALAVRRCAGISSYRLGAAFMVNIYRTSVNRRELCFAAASMARESMASGLNAAPFGDSALPTGRIRRR